MKACLYRLTDVVEQVRMIVRSGEAVNGGYDPASLSAFRVVLIPDIGSSSVSRSAAFQYVCVFSRARKASRVEGSDPCASTQTARGRLCRSNWMDVVRLRMLT